MIVSAEEVLVRIRSVKDDDLAAVLISSKLVEQEPITLDVAIAYTSPMAMERMVSTPLRQ